MAAALPPSLRALWSDGWPGGLAEPYGASSTRYDPRTLALARNVRYDAAGGLSRRAGIALRGVALPSANSRLFPYQAGGVNYVLESDGDAVRVLRRGGWTEIGAFAAAGDAPSGAAMNERQYLVNGSKWVVVERDGSGWDVRAPGVAAPAAAPGVTASGGSSSTTCSLIYAYTLHDARGFESSLGPTYTQSCKIDDTPVVTNLPTGVTLSLYGSKRDGTYLYWIATLTNNASATYTSDTLNGSRIDARPAPGASNGPPPDGVARIWSYRKRLWAAYAASPFFCWSGIGEAEYWDPEDVDEASDGRDASPILDFAAVSTGVLLAKVGSAYLLDRDPRYEASPQPVLTSRGLVRQGAIASIDGTVFMVSRGERDELIAYDGVRPQDMFKHVTRSAAELSSARRVFGWARGAAATLAYESPDDYSKVRSLTFEIDRKLWRTDDYAVATGAERGQLLDLSGAQLENLASGAAIASGGGSTTIVLDAAISTAAAAGCVIQFDGGAAIEVTAVGGTASAPELQLAESAPADGTAVEFMRGTALSGDTLTLVAALPAGSFGAAVAPAAAPTLIAYVDPPISIAAAAPQGTETRFALDWGDGAREYSGRDWVPLYERPAADNDAGMTLADINALRAEDMIATGAGTALPTLCCWLIGDGAATPTVSAAQLQYLVGAAPIVDTMQLEAAAPLSGPEIADTADELPAGRYIANTAGTWRLDDGDTDGGADVFAEIVTQERAIGDGGEVAGALLDVWCGVESAMVHVAPVVDGIEQVAVARRVTAGRPPQCWRVGFERPLHCRRIALAIRWRESELRLFDAAPIVRGVELPL